MQLDATEIWELSASLAADIITHGDCLRPWCYKDRITRACLSISGSLAEACERKTLHEQSRYLGFARNAANELRKQVNVGMEVGYLGQVTGLRWCREASSIRRKLTAILVSGYVADAHSTYR